jgi:hypothetical protein
LPDDRSDQWGLRGADTVGGLTLKLLVGSQHGAQCIKGVLASLLARPSLAHRPRHLKRASDDPTLLSGSSKEIVKSMEAAIAETVPRPRVDAACFGTLEPKTIPVAELQQ